MKTSRVLVSLGLLLVSAGAALAQNSALPPAPAPVGKPPLALYIVLTLFLAFASVLLSIMPSKRGHQD